MKIGGLTPAKSFQPYGIRMKKRDNAARMPTVDPGHVIRQVIHLIYLNFSTCKMGLVFANFPMELL